MAKKAQTGIINHVPLLDEGGRLDNLTSLAYELGQKSYDNGVVRYPTQDAKFMQLVQEQTDDIGQSIALSTAWHNGWFDAKKEVMREKFPEMYHAENGGELGSDITDMLPHSEPMGVIEPMNIMATVEPMKGGGEAKEKFDTVMSEWKDGELHIGTSDNIVPQNRQDQAVAIAFSEAQKIDPTFEDGGEAIAQQRRQMKTKNILQNEDIKSILAVKGLDKLNYSSSELDTIAAYSYDYRLIPTLLNKMWGLAFKNGFRPDKSSICAFNIGTGDILKYVPDTVKSVDAYEEESFMNMISKIIYESNKSKITVLKNYSSRSRVYDIAIGVCPTVNSIFIPNIYLNVKRGGLLVAVVESKLFTQDYLDLEHINGNYNLLQAFELPSDVSPTGNEKWSVIVLKRI